LLKDSLIPRIDLSMMTKTQRSKLKKILMSILSTKFTGARLSLPIALSPGRISKS